MTKSELILKIEEKNPHLLHRDVERIVNKIFDEMINVLVRGGRVELRGFGTLAVKQRRARRARNPRTGEKVLVDVKTVPFFKISKDLRDKLSSKMVEKK